LTACVSCSASLGWCRTWRWVGGEQLIKFSMNRDRPGKPLEPPLKAPMGEIQLGVADFFKPSNRTASGIQDLSAVSVCFHQTSFPRVCTPSCTCTLTHTSTYRRDLRPMRGLNKPQCEPMRGVHSLIIFPNANYAWAFGPLSCMCTRVCARVHVCALM
jgi:hypothetical protein